MAAARILPPLLFALLCASHCKKTDSEAASPQSRELKTVKAQKTAKPPLDGAPETRGAFLDIAVVSPGLPDFSSMSDAHKKELFLLTQAEGEERALRLAFMRGKTAQIERLLRGILKTKSRIPSDIYAKVQDYADRFLLNGGTTDAWTGKRIRPHFILGELAAAAEATMGAGVDFGLDAFRGADLGANRLEQLDRFLKSMKPALFGGVESAAADSNEKDTGADSETPPPKPPRMKEAGKQAALALKPLIAAASADEKPVFEALAAFFKSGDPAGYLDYLEKWQQTLSPFELIALFEPQGVEDDPSGPASATAGRFQMIAAVEDTGLSPSVRKVASEAAAFERALPGNAMFIRPRKDIAPLRAAAYFVAAAPPWSRPVDAAAVTSAPGTLSTSAKGQKTLLFLHAAWAKEKELGEATVRAFSADKETPALRLKWRDSALSAFLILKNVIGYQAGTRKAAADVTRVASPAEGVLKEIHSDLVALYFAFEPISKELGLVPEADCARAMLAEYVSKILEDALADDDIRNLQGRRTIARRAVVRGLLKSGAVSVDRVNDHFFVIIKDFEAARKSVETMLGESQRMISLSLSGEAQSLIDTDGGPLPKTWSASAKQRLASIGARPKTAYLFPSFSATRDKTGRIANVELHNIASLEQWVANQRGNP